MSAVVSIEGLEFYGFHGLYPEERLVGSVFIVDAEMHLNEPAGGFNDELSNTIDYSAVYATIASVMKQPKNLIETVAEKIIISLLHTQPLATEVRVTISKLHPPVGGKCERSKISLTRKRSY